jgi:hypothetical protein
MNASLILKIKQKKQHQLTYNLKNIFRLKFIKKIDNF